MVTNYLYALTHMLDITGRMSRRAYWYFLLMVLALSCVAISVDSAVLLSALTDGTPELKIGTMTMTFGALHALPSSARYRQVRLLDRLEPCALCRQPDSIFLVCKTQRACQCPRGGSA